MQVIRTLTTTVPLLSMHLLHPINTTSGRWNAGKLNPFHGNEQSCVHCKSLTSHCLHCISSSLISFVDYNGRGGYMGCLLAVLIRRRTHSLISQIRQILHQAYRRSHFVGGWLSVSLSQPSSSLIFFLTSSLPVLAHPIRAKSLLICAGTVCAISRPRPWGWTKEACNTDASLAPQRHRLGTEAGAGANLALFSSAATSCGICSESPTWHGDGTIAADQCAGRS